MFLLFTQNVSQKCDFIIRFFLTQERFQCSEDKIITFNTGDNKRRFCLFEIVLKIKKLKVMSIARACLPYSYSKRMRFVTV